MNARPARTPCLGQRVSALADGTLRDDVRDRALAHTLTCTACREALDDERRVRSLLGALPAPLPSPRLTSALLALGETGGPLPPRRGLGPGMPRPAFVSLAPPPPSGSVRPGGGTGPRSRAGVATGAHSSAHPGARSSAHTSAGRRSRAVMMAAAGALGAGFVAAGVLGTVTGAAPGAPVSPSVPSPPPAVAQFTVRQATSTESPSLPSPVGAHFAPALVLPPAAAAVGFPAGGRSGVRPAVLVLQNR